MDIRADAARFYDADPGHPNDVPFYISQVSGGNLHVLELGCGTGRVLLPLSKACARIHGVDLSDAMTTICRQKLDAAGIPSTRASVSVGDISDFSLADRFDLIIAPFRVLQNLETDRQLDGLFRCIATHLSKRGTCVLNVFNPYAPPDVIIREWVSAEEQLEWEIAYGDGTLRRYCRNTRLSPDPLVLYPDLIYRLYKGTTIVEEAVLSIAMRCYYPDQFMSLVSEHGFEVIGQWGGYEGEAYGTGPELVIRFRR
jgi:SAM-dependent methyltransferase